MTKKRSLWSINEHFESFSNAVFVSAVVVQRPQNKLTVFTGLKALAGINIKGLSMRNQKGASALSIMVILFLAASILTIVMKIAPMFFDNMTIEKVLKDIGAQPDIAELSDDEIISAFSKRFSINNIRNFDLKSIVIKRDDGLLTIDINYEKRENIFKNIDAIVSFENHFETKAQ
ncbi:DUF4845 domain-containing protein [Alkalimarinus coralli]|uniref:DUF4845 domain-containing protein n=1 Tax=Alkalimarinus coralli TaxID=2935863 RepID=UPI00202B855E|nr:DUF4845 domain-containing protein [Alkalimarinus coralli]